MITDLWFLMQELKQGFVVGRGFCLFSIYFPFSDA